MSRFSPLPSSTGPWPDVEPIPEGYQTVTPFLVLKDAHRAIEFYTKAFGAKESFRMPSASVYLYVPNVDAVFARAVAAGAEPTMSVADMF